MSSTPLPTPPTTNMTSVEIATAFYDAACTQIDAGNTVYGHVYVTAPSGRSRYFAGELYSLLVGLDIFVYLHVANSDTDIEFGPTGQLQGTLVAAVVSLDAAGDQPVTPDFGVWPSSTPKKRASTRTVRSEPRQSLSLNPPPPGPALQKKLPAPLFPNSPGWDEDDGNYASLFPDLTDERSIGRHLNVRCHVACHVPAEQMHLFPDAFLRKDFNITSLLQTYQNIYQTLRPPQGHSLLTETTYKNCTTGMNAIAAIRPGTLSSPYNLFQALAAYATLLEQLIQTLIVITATDKKERLEDYVTKKENEESKTARLRHPTFMDMAFVAKYFRQRDSSVLRPTQKKKTNSNSSNRH